MRSTRWLATVGLIGLMLALAMPTLAQKGKGGDGGKKKSGGSVPLVVVFRDANGDGFGSDALPSVANAYEDGVDGIEATLFTPSGQDQRDASIFRLRFLDASGKGKKATPGSTREVFLNMEPVDGTTAGWPASAFGNMKPNFLQTIADDCEGTNWTGGILFGVGVGSSTCARIVLMTDEFAVAWSRNDFGDETALWHPDRGQIVCVGGASGGYNCDAWVIRPHPAPPSHPSEVDFAGLDLSPLDDPNISNELVIVPFAAVLCIQSAYSVADCANLLSGQ